MVRAESYGPFIETRVYEVYFVQARKSKNKILIFLCSLKPKCPLSYQIIVILMVTLFTSFSVQGLLRLEQKFDPNWFIPERTYLSKYLQQQTKLYPDIGYEATLFVGALNYSKELPKISRTLDQIENQTNLVKDVNAWIQPFNEFVLVHYEKGKFDTI